METRTNNVPRFIVDAYELTPVERAEFDYIDWHGIDAGTESAAFVRYLGQTYDLGEFLHTDLPGWDGIATDTFFSGTVVRLSDDGESVVMGRVFT